ncbi:hypothetical protein [Streptosporangium sp. NPDC001681]|uniref:hypothetical protein n=1 Tax=Streptosporangium sp. NPDC001681 TaxID=3154395 RepID=UPI00333299D6
MSHDTNPDAVSERSCYIGIWDYATGELVDAWLLYRPAADPFFVRIPMDGSAVPLSVPRAVLQQGMDWDALSQDLWAYPSPDARWVLWTVKRGGLRERTFRVSRVLLTAALKSMYELVPLGKEGDRIDWDDALKALLKSS